MADGKVQSELINPARNFFKHSDRDPNGVWSDFVETDCDHVLLIPCFDIVELEGRSPIEVQVFHTWYGALYPGNIGSPTDWIRQLPTSSRTYFRYREANKSSVLGYSSKKREGTMILWAIQKPTLEKLIGGLSWC